MKKLTILLVSAFVLAACAQAPLTEGETVDDEGIATSGADSLTF